MTNPAPQEITYEQLERAVALWTEIGRTELLAPPTPEQELEFYRRADDDLALRLITGHQRASATATRCFQADHDAAVDELRWARQQLSEANEKLRKIDEYFERFLNGPA